ncbi:hypothetical protein JTB14_037153 [Gonioctena quinquepunctata]|nr:hypothetical protein JTB14_037153 [Gonioctena quinquepunctata]
MYYTGRVGELSDNAYRLPETIKWRLNPCLLERTNRAKGHVAGRFTKYCGIAFIVPVGVKVRYSSFWRRNLQLTYKCSMLSLLIRGEKSRFNRGG